MQNPNQLKAKWRIFIFPLTALLVFTLDQLTKTLIRANLAVNQSMFELGFFRITHVHNTGAAFGMFPDQSMLLVIIAITGITIVLFLIIFFPHRYPFLRSGISQLALGLMLGGNVGNLVDRLRFGSGIPPRTGAFSCERRSVNGGAGSSRQGSPRNLAS